MMMCCGEIISACVMAATLQKFGINAMALTGGQAGIVTDSQFGAARIKNINTSGLIVCWRQASFRLSAASRV